MNRELVDTHVHLNHPPLSDDPAAVLARAAAAGVTRVVVPAYDAPCWEDLDNLAKHAGVSIALGLHPWLAHDLAGQVAGLQGSPPAKPAAGAIMPMEPMPGAGSAAPTGAELDRFIYQLASRVAASRPVAIGEIGLDTKINASGLVQQMPLFERQLALAVDLDLPVILHCRGAFEEMLAAVAKHRGRLRGVLHAFSRGPELAERFIDAGLHIALGGAATRVRATQVRRAVQKAPLERLVLETDAPSIGLEGINPEQTEPRHVHDVAVAVAALRGMTIEALAEATTANARVLFNLP
jgi:TatD DNase family protein